MKIMYLSEEEYKRLTAGMEFIALTPRRPWLEVDGQIREFHPTLVGSFPFASHFKGAINILS